jgi:hypothetical protein
MVTTKTAIERADAPGPVDAELEVRLHDLLELLGPLGRERPGGVRVEELAEKLRRVGCRDTRELLEYGRRAVESHDGTLVRKPVVERVSEDPGAYWRSRYVLTVDGRAAATAVS